MSTLQLYRNNAAKLLHLEYNPHFYQRIPRMPNFFDKTSPILTSSQGMKLGMLFALGQVLALEHGNGIDLSNLFLGYLLVFSGYFGMMFLDQNLHYRLNNIAKEMNPLVRFSSFKESRLLIIGISLLLCASFSLIVHFYLNEFELTFPLFGIGCFIFLLYAVPPFKMKFRGGGEIIKTLALAVYIPLFSSYLQSGEWLWFKSSTLIIPLLFLVLGNTFSNSLIREKSDKYIGRRSLISTVGNSSTKLFTEYCFLAAIFLIGLFQFFIANPLPSYFAFGSMGILLLTFFQLRKVSASATLKNPTSLLQYQRYSDYGLLLSLVPIIGGVVFNYWVGP